ADSGEVASVVVQIGSMPGFARIDKDGTLLENTFSGPSSSARSLGGMVSDFNRFLASEEGKRDLGACIVAILGMLGSCAFAAVVCVLNLVDFQPNGQPSPTPKKPTPDEIKGCFGAGKDCITSIAAVVSACNY